MCISSYLVKNVWGSRRKDCGMQIGEFKKMLRQMKNLIGPRKKYSQDQMNAALEAVARGIPVATAAKIPSVPRVTLMYKSSGRLPTECRMGPSTVLTTNEEDLLEKWILSLAKVHHPVNKEQLLDNVSLMFRNPKDQTHLPTLVLVENGTIPS
ncbi:hypothetical protein JTB14_036418 [Gonioctena quinquepunctata]|nr:hypothetical protein JTB14_036418 [Gonioctena quinquepunctata]